MAAADPRAIVAGVLALTIDRDLADILAGRALARLSDAGWRLHHPDDPFSVTRYAAVEPASPGESS